MRLSEFSKMYLHLNSYKVDSAQILHYLVGINMNALVFLYKKRPIKLILLLNTFFKRFSTYLLCNSMEACMSVWIWFLTYLSIVYMFNLLSWALILIVQLITFNTAYSAVYNS